MSAPERGEGGQKDLRESLREHKARVAGVVAGATTLPRDVFDACDPAVEAALAESAMKVFRRHMMGDEHAAPNAPAPGVLREENISAAELRACARHYCALPVEEPPDLTEDLGPERMWILLDIVRHGAGLSRQRATAELRELLAAHDLAEQIGRATLEALVPLLAEAKRSKDVPVVFHALHLCAQRALHASTGEPVGPRA